MPLSGRRKLIPPIAHGSEQFAARPATPAGNNPPAAPRRDHVVQGTQLGYGSRKMNQQV